MDAGMLVSASAGKVRNSVAGLMVAKMEMNYQNLHLREIVKMSRRIAENWGRKCMNYFKTL